MSSMPVTGEGTLLTPQKKVKLIEKRGYSLIPFSEKLVKFFGLLLKVMEALPLQSLLLLLLLMPFVHGS